MLKILVADDHALVRAGLCRILSEALQAVELTEAASADELVACAMRQHFDLALIDLSMPGRSGLDALRELATHRPALPVLMLSMHAEEQFAIRALEAGARGYITKERAPEELIAAVRRVLAGRRYVSPTLAERLVDERLSGVEAQPHEALSPREFEVLLALASGRSASEIAAELGLSVKTVSTYRTRLLEKLRLETTAQLIQYAVQHRLVEWPAAD